MRETLGRFLRNLADRLAGGDPASASHPGARPSGSQTPRPTSRGSSLPWWRACETTRSSAWTRTATCGAGMPVPSTSRVIGRTRSWDSTSRGSTTKSPSRPASPRASCDGPGDGTVRGGRLAKAQGRFPLLGQRPDHGPAGPGRDHQRILEDHSGFDGTQGERGAAAPGQCQPREPGRGADRGTGQHQPAARRGQQPLAVGSHREDSTPRRPSRRRIVARTSSSRCSATSCGIPSPACETRFSSWSSRGRMGTSAGETHAMMERQVEQLTGIVDDLLDVSRIVRAGSSCASRAWHSATSSVARWMRSGPSSSPTAMN